MKKCPACAEEIQDEAVKCKHCGTDLSETPKTSVASNSAETGAILGLFMLILPITTTLLIWFWVGNMNLLEGPGSKLNWLTVLTIAGTAILGAIEANKLGMGNKSDINKKGKKNPGPMHWFLGIALLWIVGYPWYLRARSKYGVKNYLLPGIFIALIFTSSLVIMSLWVEARIENLRSDFMPAQHNKADNNDEYNAEANSALRDLRTLLEIHFADYSKYPDNSELSEFLKKNNFQIPEDVEVSYSKDDTGKGSVYAIIVYHKKGNLIYSANSEEAEIRTEKK